MRQLKHYLLKLAMVFIGVIIISTPLVWRQIYHPQATYLAGYFLDQYSIGFLMFRFGLILGIYLAWPKMIVWRSKKLGWEENKLQFWLSKRLLVVGWLLIIEIIICENFLMKTIKIFLINI